MEEIRLKQSTGKALKFKGELIGSAEESANTAHPKYSGITGRWTELHLWRTSGGNYVGRKSNFTQWQGERKQLCQ